MFIDFLTIGLSSVFSPQLVGFVFILTMVQKNVPDYDIFSLVLSIYET